MIKSDSIIHIGQVYNITQYYTLIHTVSFRQSAMHTEEEDPFMDLN